MDNKDFDSLFDDEVRSKIKNSFDDIKLTSELKEKINTEALINKGFKKRVYDFFNYEIEIPIGRIGVIAAILSIIPTAFTLHEGNKIMDNNIEYNQGNISENNI
ncbi:hypothetical protein [Clostridium sp. D53t1_180928_C8]|uniref:hypothetical protein n=1 Tax=Clostridium sp. D53t1_180928_C8 TaxID=2787101 RepID=UPI0018A888F4|nr:hypothetical protein [Clostridium sp. D53t1_180928_C8]